MLQKMYNTLFGYAHSVSRQNLLHSFFVGSHVTVKA